MDPSTTPQLDTMPAVGHVRLLCVGDLHLGRAPSRIADSALSGTGISVRDLSPVQAWSSIVQSALAQRVDAVLLLGDVLDSANALLESIGPFGAGVSKLAAADIPVIAVAGNHDADSLPQLVDSVDGIQLLGRDGWEAYNVRAANGAAVRLVGWSFPQGRVTRSPLSDLAPAMLDSPDGHGAPTLGMLHCDLDVSDSSYAPVRRAELERCGFDGWLLGHIHTPDPLDAQRVPLGYLGGVVGLDPSERGWRGAWIAKCGSGGIQLERLHVARHRYERIELDVSDIEAPSEIIPAMSQAAREHHAAIRESIVGERAIIGRLHLTGSHRTPDALIEELVRAGDLDGSSLEIDGIVHIWEGRVTSSVRVAIDVAALAASPDVAAPIAALDLAARGEAGVDPELSRRLRAHLRAEVMSKPGFRDLGDELDEHELATVLERAIQHALITIDQSRATRA